MTKEWRGRDLPSDWRTTRKRVLARDGSQCVKCHRGPDDGVKLEIDHVGNRDEHHDDNLRTLCSECHQERTKLQTAAGRKEWHKRVAASKAKFRRVEEHPGLLRTTPGKRLPPYRMEG